MTDVCMSLYRHVVGDSSDCMYTAGSVNLSCAWPRPAVARMVRGMVLRCDAAVVHFIAYRRGEMGICHSMPLVVATVSKHGVLLLVIW